MKRVVSVSLGSSKGNKSQEAEILGEKFSIERIGVDGDIKRYAEMFKELDGKVDALGVGGADLWVVAGNKRYGFKQILKIAAHVKNTPVVDGSGLKHTLERRTIDTLQKDGTVDFKTTKTLLVSAVDRFGMADALYKIGGPVIYGDVLFGLGLPFPVRKYSTVQFLGKVLLPIVTSLPIQWFYPTGDKQDKRAPKYPKVWMEVDLIAGDKHIVFRNMSPRLDGKMLLTQTLRKADFEELKKAGLKRVITTTPVMGGESFATNVMEGVLVAASGRKPSELSENDYLEWLDRLNWKPNVIDL